MIGILLALQVNNWNEQRKDRIEEKNILANFQEVLKKDLSGIRVSVSFHESVKSSINIVLTSLGNQSSYHDSLSYHFWNTTSIWALPITESVFETLKSKGIDLITNESLRNSIIEFYDTDNRLFKRDQDNYSDFLDHASKNIFNSRFDSYWSANYDTLANPNEWNEQYIIENMEGRMVPLKFEELKLDSEFKYFLRTLSNRYTAHIKMPGDKMQFKIIELIDMIDQEVSKGK